MSGRADARASSLALALGEIDGMTAYLDDMFFALCYFVDMALYHHDLSM